MLKRYIGNPVLSPSTERFWESDSVFNPCPTEFSKKILMLYRACCKIQRLPGDIVTISSVGLAESKDGINFKNRRFFFGPEYDYEAYGCEDPRVTKFKGKYFITYTAVSDYPPKPENVRLSLAVTEDFSDYEKKGIICPYNSKAGALFPREIDGKKCMIFTINPDLPPSKIAIACFDKFDELLTEEYWREWKKEDNIVEIPGKTYVEVGSPPIETDEGWLLIMPDIVSEGKKLLELRIGAMLLDLENPKKVISITKEPILVPEKEYETKGRAYPVTNITMPTGAIVREGKLYVYYGASDLYCCVATCDLEDLLKLLTRQKN